MSLLLPPALTQDLVLGVVSSSGPIDDDTLKRGLDALRSHVRHVEPLRPPGDGPSVPEYLADSDPRRLQSLLAGLEQRQVGALIAERGGYGSMRLLDALAAAAPTSSWRPKRFVGFSDATALHAWLHFQLGWASILGPMPLNMSQHAGMAADVAAALCAEGPIEQRFAGLRCECPGQARGRLFGGNLSLVEALYRSPFLPSLEGVILLLEDVGERRYRLDRLLCALALRGAVKELSGVLLGQFTEAADADEDAALRHVVELLRPWGLPVLSGMPVGHSAKNRCVWLGADAELDGERGELRLRLG